MSEENVEVIRAAVKTFNDEDYESWIATFDPECEFWPLRAQLEGRPYCGHEGLREFLRDVSEELEEPRLRLLDLRVAGDEVVANANMSARGRASHAAIEARVAFVARMREGRTVYFRFYSDPEQVKATGLSE
jgi:ketosteroid isomerase-like protein